MKESKGGSGPKKTENTSGASSSVPNRQGRCRVECESRSVTDERQRSGKNTPTPAPVGSDESVNRQQQRLAGLGKRNTKRIEVKRKAHAVRREGYSNESGESSTTAFAWLVGRSAAPATASAANWFRSEAQDDDERWRRRLFRRVISEHGTPTHSPSPAFGLIHNAAVKARWPAASR